MGKFKTKLILLSIILICLLPIQISAQGRSIKDLPQPDWKFKLLQAFFKTAEFVFVITDVEDSVTYKNIWTLCKKRSMPNVRIVVKHENQLAEDDYDKHMLVCGPIHCFKKWDTFGIPIKQIQDGFQFGPNSFNDANDGVFFISSDTTRVAYTGNTLSPIYGLLRTITGLYQYTIVQNSIPAHFGNFVRGQFDSRGHIDLRKERKTYLNRTTTSRHYVFHYSDKIADTSKFNVKANHFDQYCEEAIARLELEQPDYKIHCYIYTDENEKFVLSGTPGPGGVTYGKEIHTLGFDFIEHESIHVLFNYAVAQPNNNFFNEGIRQYYEYITDTKSLAEGRKTVRKYLNEPIEKWANGSIYFFGTPTENRWPVAYPASGLFVKYLVDNHGLDKFKQFYRKLDVEAGFLEVYGKPLADMVKEWKEAEQE
jgi:hypothetical protein